MGRVALGMQGALMGLQGIAGQPSGEKDIKKKFGASSLIIQMRQLVN